MLTFKQLNNELLKYLKDNNAGLSVEFGKFGGTADVLPQNPPCVWIYGQPNCEVTKNHNKAPINYKAAFELFICTSGGADINFGSFLDCIELAEIIYQQINAFPEYANSLTVNVNNGLTGLDYPDDFITVDGLYGDLAVMCLQFNLTYSLHREI